MLERVDGGLGAVRDARAWPGCWTGSCEEIADIIRLASSQGSPNVTKPALASENAA
jgi:hypothetical protein